MHDSRQKTIIHDTALSVFLSTHATHTLAHATRPRHAHARHAPPHTRHTLAQDRKER